MQILQSIVLSLVLVLAAHNAVCAEEELFDTSAAAAHFEKGIEHLRAKQLEAAITELEEAVSIYPDADSHYYLGYAYYLKGRSGDSASRKNSMENFDKAFELDPGFKPNRFKSVADARTEAFPLHESQPEPPVSEAGQDSKPAL